jgi:hypothetical protein
MWNVIALWVFFSIILVALAVIVGAVTYAIVGTAVHALGSLMRSSTDTLRPRQLGVSESDARAPLGSEVPGELPASSAEAMWERMQGTQRPATASRNRRRAKFWS